MSNGGATGARTPDLLHAMQMLFQLSYRPAAVMLPRRRECRRSWGRERLWVSDLGRLCRWR